MTAPGAPVLALCSAACFAAALIVTHFGLRFASSHAGARVSLSATCIVWWVLATFLLDLSAWHAGAAAIFAAVGLFYPAAVTVLTYESNRQLGPTLTGAISSTAPLFATAFAVVLLDERLTVRIVAGSLTIVSALVLMSWRRSTGTPAGWRVLLPLTGAALRGLAHALSKLGLGLWGSPFAATLIGYTVSGAAIWGSTLALGPREPQHMRRAAILWFVAGGVLNGCALLLLYHALNNGRVAVVAPLVALYPVFTMVFSALLLKTEVFTRRIVAGAFLAVAGVAILVTG